MQERLSACFVMFLVGCASDESAVCTFPDNAVFEAQYTERAGGTCGPIDNANITSRGTGETQSSCAIPAWTVDDGGCHRARLFTCIFDQETVISNEELMYLSNDDWAGTYSTRVTGPSVCASVYDLVLVRR